MIIIKRVLFIILVFLMSLPMLTGCKKEGKKVEYYSGPETIYPKNMPAALSIPHKELSEISDLKIEFDYYSFEELMTPDFSPNSWYRVTVDRILSDSESKELKGYSAHNKWYTFFRATLWYDYVREEKCEREAIIAQIGRGDYNSVSPMYQVGGTYIMLLSEWFKSDFIWPMGMENAVFAIYEENGQEYAYKLVGRFEDLSKIEKAFDISKFPEGYNYKQCFPIESIHMELRHRWKGKLSIEKTEDTQEEGGINKDFNIAEQIVGG